MSQLVHVFAPGHSGAPWQWCRPLSGAGPDASPALTRDPGSPYETGTGLAALTSGSSQGDAQQRAPVVLVVPGEEVLTARVAVPTRSRHRIQAALPYLVEDFLAEDVDQMHLASGQRGEDGAVPVHALRPERLRGWLEELAAAGLTASAARVDHDALGSGAGQLTVWIGAQRALVRSMRCAFAVERDELTGFLSALLAAGQAGEACLCRLCATEDADADLLLAELTLLLGERAGVTVEQSALGSNLEAAITEGLASAPSLNAPVLELLTGNFRPARRQVTGHRWALAASLLVAWFLVEGALDMGRTAWLQARTEVLQEENLALFRDLVPGRTRSPDPRRELEGLLGQSGAASPSFLRLLGVLAAELAPLDSASKLRSIHWNSERGDLAISLLVPGINQIDHLKAQLEAGGYGVIIDVAGQAQEGIQARLRVRTRDRNP